MYNIAVRPAKRGNAKWVVVAQYATWAGAVNNFVLTVGRKGKENFVRLERTPNNDPLNNRVVHCPGEELELPVKRF